MRAENLRIELVRAVGHVRVELVQMGHLLLELIRSDFGWTTGIVLK